MANIPQTLTPCHPGTSPDLVKPFLSFTLFLFPSSHDALSVFLLSSWFRNSPPWRTFCFFPRSPPRPPAGRVQLNKHSCSTLQRRSRRIIETLHCPGLQGQGPFSKNGPFFLLFLFSWTLRCFLPRGSFIWWDVEGLEVHHHSLYPDPLLLLLASWNANSPKAVLDRLCRGFL